MAPSVDRLSRRSPHLRIYTLGHLQIGFNNLLGLMIKRCSDHLGSHSYLLGFFPAWYAKRAGKTVGFPII